MSVHFDDSFILTCLHFYSYCMGWDYQGRPPVPEPFWVAVTEEEAVPFRSVYFCPLVSPGQLISIFELPEPPGRQPDDWLLALYSAGTVNSASMSFPSFREITVLATALPEPLT